MLPLPPVPHPVHQQGLAHEVEERHARVERRERILEDHLHLAPQRAQRPGRERPHVGHRAVGEPHRDLARRRLDRAKDAARRRGLSAAAFAHESQRLAFVDVEVDAVHRAHVSDRPPQQSLPDRKELLQAGDAKERPSVRAHG